MVSKGLCAGSLMARWLRRRQIVFSVIPSVAEAQVLPDPDSPDELTFSRLDMFFTAVFTFELLLNMAATLVREFTVSGWNWCEGVYPRACSLGAGVSRVHTSLLLAQWK